jgi:hypothetical protein
MNVSLTLVSSLADVSTKRHPNCRANVWPSAVWPGEKKKKKTARTPSKGKKERDETSAQTLFPDSALILEVTFVPDEDDGD